MRLESTIGSLQSSASQVTLLTANFTDLEQRSKALDGERKVMIERLQAAESDKAANSNAAYEVERLTRELEVLRQGQLVQQQQYDKDRSALLDRIQVIETETQT